MRSTLSAGAYRTFFLDTGVAELSDKQLLSKEYGVASQRWPADWDIFFGHGRG